MSTHIYFILLLCLSGQQNSIFLFKAFTFNGQSVKRAFFAKTSHQISPENPEIKLKYYSQASSTFLRGSASFEHRLIHGSSTFSVRSEIPLAQIRLFVNVVHRHERCKGLFRLDQVGQMSAYLGLGRQRLSSRHVEIGN